MAKISLLPYKWSAATWMARKRCGGISSLLYEDEALKSALDIDKMKDLSWLYDRKT